MMHDGGTQHLGSDPARRGQSFPVAALHGAAKPSRLGYVGHVIRGQRAAAFGTAGMAESRLSGRSGLVHVGPSRARRARRRIAGLHPDRRITVKSGPAGAAALGLSWQSLFMHCTARRGLGWQGRPSVARVGVARRCRASSGTSPVGVAESGMARQAWRHAAVQGLILHVRSRRGVGSEARQARYGIVGVGAAAMARWGNAGRAKLVGVRGSFAGLSGARPCEAKLSMAGQARVGPASEGFAPQGGAWQRSARQARPSNACPGKDRHGKGRQGTAGLACRHPSRAGLSQSSVAQRCAAWQAWQGRSTRGQVLRSAGDFGAVRQAWHGRVWRHKARLGMVRHRWAGQAGYGRASLGLARRGRQGAALDGLSGGAEHCLAVCVEAAHGGAGTAVHGLSGQGTGWLSVGAARQARHGAAAFRWQGCVGQGRAQRGTAGSVSRGTS